MKKFISFIIIASLCLYLGFTAFATSGTSGLNVAPNVNPFIDWLDGASFRIRVWNSEETLITDEYTSLPVHYGSYSRLRLDILPINTGLIDNIFVALRKHSQISFKLYINDSQVPLAFSGGSRVTNHYGAFASSVVVESIYFEFTNAPPDGVTSVLGLFSNIVSSYQVPEFTVHYDYIASLYHDGTFSYIENTLDSYIYNDTSIVSFPKKIYPSDMPSTSYDLEWFKPRIVIPLSNLNSDFIDYFTLTFSCYGSLADATAFVSRYSLGTIYEDSFACQVNITSMPCKDSPGVGFKEDISNFGYQLQINTEGLNLRDQFLIIQLEIQSRAYSYGSNQGFAAVWQWWGLDYTLDLKYSSSLLSNIYVALQNQISFLERYSDDLNFLRVELGSFHETVVRFYNQYLTDSEKINSILDALTQTNGIITDIYDWLNDFTPESGSSLDVSINNANTSYNTLEQNIQYLETVPKMEVEDYSSQLDQISNSLDILLQAPVDLDDPSFRPGTEAFSATPLTVTSVFSNMFSVGENLGFDFDIGSLLVLVASIALIGYVLFGKR